MTISSVSYLVPVVVLLQPESHELDSYMASSDSSDNILAFWCAKAAVWPKLSSVACAILAIPATKTSPKQVFSVADRTVEDR